MAGPIRIAILANASQAKAELASTAGAAQKIESKFSKFRGPALAALGGIALLTKAVVTSASQSQQSLGATQTVFGTYANKVISNSKRAANEVGLSANSYRENANLIGSLFKNQGVATDQLAGKTHAMVKTGADLAATFGGSTKEAVEALGSAFKGEFNPMEKYGVSLKQSNINAELAARGQDKLKGAALKQATQQAITKLIMDQSKDSLGAFGRESNTLAGQQQRLGAQFENLKATLGTALLPTFTKLADVAAKFSTWAAEHPSLITGVVAAIAALSVVVLAASIATKIQVAATTLWAVVTGVARAASVAWTVAQWALNAAMLANPMGLVILAIVALVAVFVIAWKKSETFRSIVIGAWQAIKAATSSVWNFIKNLLSTVWSWIKTAITTYFTVYKTIITTAWNLVKTITSSVWNFIKSLVSTVVGAVKTVISNNFNLMKTIITTAWNAVKTATVNIWQGIKTAVSNGVERVMELIRGIKGKITGFFKGAGDWLWSAGKAIIQGLIDGANELIDKFKGIVSGLTDWIPKGKGPLDKDKRMLRPAGKAIIDGLIYGFKKRIPEVRKTLNGLTKDIAGFSANMSGSIDLTAKTSLVGASVTPTQSNTYNITVVAPVGASSADIGRTLTKHIDAYEKVGGRRRA